MADLLLRQPAVDANVVQREFGVTNPSALAAIAHLVEGGVLRQVSHGKWGRKWVAPTVLEALSCSTTGLPRQTSSRMTPYKPWSTTTDCDP